MSDSTRENVPYVALFVGGPKDGVQMTIAEAPWQLCFDMRLVDPSMLEIDALPKADEVATLRLVYQRSGPPREDRTVIYTPKRGQKLPTNHCPTCGAHTLHWTHPLHW